MSDVTTLYDDSVLPETLPTTQYIASSSLCVNNTINSFYHDMNIMSQ